MGFLEILRAPKKVDLTDPAVREKWTVERYFEEGRKFAREKGLDTHLPLEENDKFFLYRLIGLKLAYEQLDKSKSKQTGISQYTKDTYEWREDTPNTTRLRENVIILENSIDGFIRNKYNGFENRAQVIRQAVNNLFIIAQSDTYGGSAHKMGEVEIRIWAEQWRPRIITS